MIEINIEEPEYSDENAILMGYGVDLFDMGVSPTIKFYIQNLFYKQNLGQELTEAEKEIVIQFTIMQRMLSAGLPKLLHKIDKEFPVEKRLELRAKMGVFSKKNPVLFGNGHYSSLQADFSHDLLEQAFNIACRAQQDKTLSKEDLQKENDQIKALLRAIGNSLGQGFRRQ